MNIDEAKEYLKEVMETKFRDKTFYNHIAYGLTGDFAGEVAQVIKSLTAELAAAREDARTAEAQALKGEENAVTSA